MYNTVMDNSRRKSLTDEVLTSLFEGGLSDSKIGAMFDLTGEGVAYRRKKLGLLASEKHTEHRTYIEKFKKTPADILSTDYYSLTQKEFSSKYCLSKTVWLPHLRSLGVLSKHEKRLNSFPPLTLDQRRLIVASLLGDGGITEDGCYYEFHSDKQLQYLTLKERLLRPYSKGVKQVSNGYEFETISHPVFREFRSLFYSSDFKGKLIPLEAITEIWDDSILAYWFFDDGHFNDEEGTATIANFCPVKEQLDSLVSFLNDRYPPWKFSCHGTSIYRVFLPQQYQDEFGNLLARFATPDLYYKIPERCLTPNMIPDIDLEKVLSIKPKFYRVCDSEGIKSRMEEAVFQHYRSKGFPFMHHTEDRLNYLLKEFQKFNPQCLEGRITHSPSGQSLCENFFPNIYESNRKGSLPPVDLWQDDEWLRKLIRNRLRYADRITNASMRTGIKLSGACVSNFKPSVAKFLYSEYGFNGKILDYSCGFGSRMLASMSLGMEYCGFEPSAKTYDNLIRFGNYLKRRIGGSFEIKRSGSEEAPFKENYFGLAFSSPPYFDFEHYSDDPGQSIVRFPALEDWVGKYWKETIYNCSVSLVEEGFWAVCLSPSFGNLIEKTFSFAQEVGLYFYQDFLSPFKQVFSGGDKTEIVLVFSKKPHNRTPRFYGCSSTVVPKFSVKIKDDLMEVSTVKRVVRTSSEIDQAILKFKEVCAVHGVARETYRDSSLLGVPSYILEHKFGSWNSFIKVCGLAPSYVAQSPKDHTKDFLKACLDQGKVLSFYSYEKVTGNPATRLKRLFNSGKPYHHLLAELRVVALKPPLWPDFLRKLE